MPSEHPWRPVILLWLACLLLFPSCSGLGPAPGDTGAALDLARQATQHNESLTTCKGTGWIRLAASGENSRFRVAWVASLPDRLRMTLLSSGHPVATLIADGRQVTALSHTGRYEPQVLRSPDPSLERLISVRVTLGDVIAFLSGRIPVEPFDAATATPLPASGETALSLARRWRGPLALIRLDANGDVIFFRPLNNREEPLYTVTLDDYRTVGQYRIPFHWTLSDAKGRTMILELSSYMADIPVKEAAFSLTESR